MTDYMKPDTETYNWVIQAYTRAESYDRWVLHEFNEATIFFLIQVIIFVNQIMREVVMCVKGEGEECVYGENGNLILQLT